ncbi:DUF2330 domain-containing protein [Pseudanabaena sp. PCC 6802]|uniref:DUF2330 domain-containing protein n=1 Tax=Pseudanabaena sp. PCC 6802 TaxID=118173 RepID=UPI0004775BC1
MKPLRILISIILVFALILSFALPASAFCGFYVAKADTKLYNQASQVIIARDSNRTILTMANDYKGDVKDFAIVVPVPTLLKKEQVRVGESKILDRLDAFSAPRLVEYYDSDPCAIVEYDRVFKNAPLQSRTAGGTRGMLDERGLGVTIEERFTVGEYDILILSAKESDGLETWLTENGYRIPAGASQLLQPYIRQNMKFFVAKVNLKEFDKTGSQLLRPLMMAYESPRFMLPIRLGMVNANAAQDLIVYLLSPKGQVEVANYRTVKVPSGDEIPVFVKNEFGDFYKAMFKTAYDREDRKVAFMEYAWDMSSCDPCSADPLTPEELRQAGVFWLDSGAPAGLTVPFRRRRPFPNPQFSGGVFITRLHIRYTRDRFPEDLIFKSTSNREQFQGRYVMRHAFKGEASCEAGKEYKRSLPKRFEREAQTLATLTGWDIQDIRRKIGVTATTSPNMPFWRNIWR